MSRNPDFDHSLGRLARRSKRVPLLIRLPFILVPVGLPIYWMITGSGLYYYFAMTQAEFMNGEHYIAISVMLPMLLLLIPSLIIIWAIAGFFPDKKKEDV